MATKAQTSGILYVVGTPLGNLEDISLRALRILKEVDLIAAEDTRVCRKLLSHYAIDTPTTPWHAHSAPAKLARIVSRIKAGENVALVSDAGMPGISDPGEKLVAAAIEARLKVVPVPGPSALVCALAVSGLPTADFLFIGFLPRKKSERRAAIADLAATTATLIFYEAPHRLPAALADLQAGLGDRRAAAARELTKKFEEVVRGALSEIAAHFAGNAPRGELTLVVEGAAATSAREQRRQAEKESLPQALAEAKMLISRGLSAKDAARQIASAYGISRRALYNALQKEDS